MNFVWNKIGWRREVITYRKFWGLNIVFIFIVVVIIIIIIININIFIFLSSFSVLFEWYNKFCNKNIFEKKNPFLFLFIQFFYVYMPSTTCQKQTNLLNHSTQAHTCSHYINSFFFCSFFFRSFSNFFIHSHERRFHTFHSFYARYDAIVALNIHSK